MSAEVDWSQCKMTYIDVQYIINNILGENTVFLILKFVIAVV